MNERIKKLRRYLDLTQQEFAEKIGTHRNNIAGYETGRRLPSEAVISLICKTFNVSDTWLRTGKGGMFAPEINDTLGAFIRERNLTTTDRILIEKFVSLSVKARWEVVNFVLSIADALWEECSVSAREGMGSDAGRQAADATPAHADDDNEQKAEAIASAPIKLYGAASDGSRPEPELGPDFNFPHGEQLQTLQEKEGIGDTPPAQEET